MGYKVEVMTPKKIFLMYRATKLVGQGMSLNITLHFSGKH